MGFIYSSPIRSKWTSSIWRVWKGQTLLKTFSMNFQVRIIQLNIKLVPSLSQLTPRDPMDITSCKHLGGKVEPKGKVPQRQKSQMRQCCWTELLVIVSLQWYWLILSPSCKKSHVYTVMVLWPCEKEGNKTVNIYEFNKEGGTLAKMLHTK